MTRTVLRTPNQSTRSATPFPTRREPRSAVAPPAPDLSDETTEPDEEDIDADTADETALRWPAAPLDAAQRAFDLLTRPPAPLAFDCRTIPGLDQDLQFIGLDELRDLLLLLLTDDELAVGADFGTAMLGRHRARVAASARTSTAGRTSGRATGRVAGRVARRSDGARRQVSDAIWRELVTRARRDGPAWVVAAVGVALPGLRRRVRLLARGWHGEVADLESEMLLGFLERLRTVDVDDVNICSRLISAGARAVELARAYEDDNDAARNAVPHSVPPARPWDHPELVLSRAVHAGAITARDATVIARTRLENDTLVGIAAELDVSVATVTSWRQRAEARLTEAIRAGDL